MPVWLREGVLPLLGAGGLLAAGFCLLLYFAQDRLIFYPQALSEADARAVERNAPQAQTFIGAAKDGTDLRGWLVRGDGPLPRPLAIYFGGNAEEVSWQVPAWPIEFGWSVLLVNYRGYGVNRGAPSEAALYSDALALYDQVRQCTDVDARHVVAIGRSLGSGVATYLASQRTVAGLILISPYDSLADVAREVYPFLPIDLLLRHRFESQARAPLIHAPLLALAAEQDTLIRPQRSLRLVQAWGGPARLELLNGVDHNTIHRHPDYWPQIARFLRRRAAGP
jgi:uncharacterized protein